MVNGKTARAHWVCRKQSQMPEGIRLNKFLASCGVASRRKCDDLIAEGHVEINGKIVIELGTKVLPTDHVKFDGRRLSQESEMTIILNKPMGYVCTRHDPEGRKTIYELLPKKFQHLNYVGRLDIQSSGLLILTNSGELNELLTHPRYHVHKEYEVYLDRAFDPAHTKAFIDGIPITEGLAKAVSVDFFPESAATWCWLRATTARFAACFRGWVTKCVISSAFALVVSWISIFLKGAFAR